MIKPLHQQLADKVRQIDADEALVAEEAESWRTSTKTLVETHQAKERLPRLRDELATLRTDIEVATAAKYELARALVHMGTQCSGSRQLSLAITATETALWRLGNHLGVPVNRESPPPAADPHEVFADLQKRFDPDMGSFDPHPSEIR